MINNNSTYSPNFPGATSLRDTRRFHVTVDGYDQNVTASTYSHQGGQWITVHVGCRTAFEGPVPAELTDMNIMEWIRTVATEWATAKDEPVVTVELGVDEFIRVSVKAGAKISARNFGRLAAGAARRHGKCKIARISSGGSFSPRAQIYTYTYARA